MPPLVDIVTNLVSTMRAVPTAGAVHPRARSALATLGLSIETHDIGIEAGRAVVKLR